MAFNANHLLLEEPIRLSSILESSITKPFFGLTKIIGTIGEKSRSVETLEALLLAGMTVARFDFSSGDADYHQESLENLKLAIKKTKKLCSVMLDTSGSELIIKNAAGKPIELKVNEEILLTPDESVEASSSALPINRDISQSVKPGDTIFLGQYLFTGSESTSVWLEVIEARGNSVACSIKNSAVLSGLLLTAHASLVHINAPTLTENDKYHISTWGLRNNVDFISLSFTRTAEDVRQVRALLSRLGDLYQTQVFAKIENLEGLTNFDSILEEADGIILSRGNLGIDLPSEKVFLLQKAALHKCNMAGKPAVLTRVVDTMTETPRPTRAEATDVANAVLDGADAILLGAETFRGLYPVEAVVTVKKICHEAEKVFNQELYFKRTVKYVGEEASQLEAVASSAVRAAEKVRASVIIVFSSSGRAARLIAKYRPTMPVLVLVVPRLSTNQLRWSFTGAFQARQCLVLRGLFPMLADPGAADHSTTNESLLKVAMEHGKAAGLIRTHDRVVVCQKIGDSSVVKIVDIEN